MREPLKLDQGDHYERPNQSWICGLADEGPPCPLGPTAGGRCSHAMGCHPLREGDRWICNRSAMRGGPCDKGPTPDGECCIYYSCTPVRSLRTQRGRFVTALVFATLGGLLLAMSGNWRNEFLAPGGLSVHHAQLTARGNDQSQRCANCHVAGNQSAFEWLSHAWEPNLSQPTQSTLCLECHQKQLPIATALMSHGIDMHLMTATHEKDLSSRAVDPSGEFACSTCHREHHGASHDLSAMSNSACQACHQEQYHSFATDHPEFDRWPNLRRTPIAFDHASHQMKHFPAEKQNFSCAQCHKQTEAGFQETLGYEASCAKCHDSDLSTSWEAGIAFINLPMIDTEALADQGVEITGWSEEATGDFDGALSPAVKLLLLGDEQAAKAIQLLEADFDFYDVDPGDETQVKAAANVIKAFQEFLKDLSTQGHAAIESRLEKVVRRPIDSDELAALVAHLSPDDMQVMGNGWSPAAETSESAADDKQKLEGGGWLRDDASFVLRYRPSGHADPWLTSWIDLLAESTRGPHAAIAEKLLHEVMKPTAPGMCGSCHSVDRSPGGGFQVNWLASAEEKSGPRFTVFSHAPHTLQTELSDCTVCHRINEKAAVMETYNQEDVRQFAAGFHAMTKQDCATCHKPNAAGDSCTQCHRYHVTAK